MWRSEDVEDADIEGVSDLYVRAWVNQDKAMETDTHYRCQNGRGSWNWRLKFPLEIEETPRFFLNLQFWDRDFFSANDVIGDATLDFTELAMEAWESGLRVKMYGAAEGLKDRMLRRENEKFWVKFTKRDAEGETRDVGKLLVSFELVPEHMAIACPVGKGHEEPNVDPPLPAPFGRFNLSWNPFNMATQMCGPEVKTKICCGTCCLLCCVVLILMFPVLLSNLLAGALFG